MSDGRHEVHRLEVDWANDGPVGFAESWEGSGATPEQLVADARAAVAEQYPAAAGNPLCAQCSPDGIEEERAYWAWRESAESAGHFPEDRDDE